MMKSKNVGGFKLSGGSKVSFTVYCLYINSFLKFKKKGKYLIPCIIMGVKSGNEYIISPALNFKNLKKNKNYNVDYKLVADCYANSWEKILKDLIEDN